MKINTFRGKDNFFYLEILDNGYYDTGMTIRVPLSMVEESEFLKFLKIGESVKCNLILQPAKVSVTDVKVTCFDG